MRNFYKDMYLNTYLCKGFIQMYVNSNADYFGIVGGDSDNTATAGMWDLYLSHSLARSGDSVGCSASLYPHMDIK